MIARGTKPTLGKQKAAGRRKEETSSSSDEGDVQMEVSTMREEVLLKMSTALKELAVNCEDGLVPLDGEKVIFNDQRTFGVLVNREAVDFKPTGVWLRRHQADLKFLHPVAADRDAVVRQEPVPQRVDLLGVGHTALGVGL